VNEDAPCRATLIDEALAILQVLQQTNSRDVWDLHDMVLELIWVFRRNDALDCGSNNHNVSNVVGLQS